jgi:S-adenosylmethionine hydrolase
MRKRNSTTKSSLLQYLSKFTTHKRSLVFVSLNSSMALLEIAFNQENAVTLLGLQYDSPVCVSFHS